MQTSADSAVRILSGITVRCLSVEIKFKFENFPDTRRPSRMKISDFDRPTCYNEWNTLKKDYVQGLCKLTVRLMLVTDVGDRLCRQQVWDVGDRFEMLMTDFRIENLLNVYGGYWTKVYDQRDLCCISYAEINLGGCYSIFHQQCIHDYRMSLIDGLRWFTSAYTFSAIIV